MSNRVVHFEIYADDVNRAKMFYETAFDWKVTKWQGPTDYWLITTGDKQEPGIDGGLMKRMGPPPAGENPITAYVCTIGVDSVDKTVDVVTKAGGKVALPKTSVPGIGWLAYVTDTEGNILGLMSSDPQAK